MSKIDALRQKIEKEISEQWDNDILQQVKDYIRIPNKSPMFDSKWKEHGYMDQAMDLMIKWCEKQPINGMTLDLVQLPERTPLLFIEIPGAIGETVLLYGHMDKQPEMVGWDENKGPWLPVMQGDKLYGRGGADDGYAVFSSLAAIAALQRHNIPHARCILIIEACEESGSYDLPFYLEHLKPRIGTPNLVICLDSGAGNYEQLWSTTSLRGLVGGDLTIEVLKEGVHSGMGSGIVPTTSMILRQLLDRVENKETGEILLDELKVEIPEERIEQAKLTASELGDSIVNAFPFIHKTRPVSNDTTDLLINRTWKARLSVTGMDGIPPSEIAGNVTLPRLSAKLSFRIPPTCDSKVAAKALKETLEKNPPFDAKVTFNPEDKANGWNAPELSPWLIETSNKASELFYQKPCAYIGEGGTIPFMGMLGDMYPEAQFLIAGVLGPKSNAHGPNEFLHIPMVKKLTCCVSAVLAYHFEHFQKNK
jgi:acetylornithine deacetylase/succinyl-diaminopimelate desuccinylase-like protein